MEMRGPLPAFLSRPSREREASSAASHEKKKRAVPKRRARRPVAEDKANDPSLIRGQIGECSLQPNASKINESVGLTERSDTDISLAKIVESLRARIRAMEKEKEFEARVLDEFRLEAGNEGFTERRVIFLKAQLLCMERQIEKLERALARGQTPPCGETIAMKSIMLESESVIASAVQALQEAHSAAVGCEKVEMDNLCEVLREACYHLLKTWRNVKSGHAAQSPPLGVREPEGCCKECQKKIEEWVKAHSAASDLRIDQMRDEHHIRNVSSYSVGVLSVVLVTLTQSILPGTSEADWTVGVR